MRGTRKGFGNVEETYVTSFKSLMQFHKEIHGLLRGGVPLTTARLSVRQAVFMGCRMASNMSRASTMYIAQLKPFLWAIIEMDLSLSHWGSQEKWVACRLSVACGLEVQERVSNYILTDWKKKFPLWSAFLRNCRDAL